MHTKAKEPKPDDTPQTDPYLKVTISYTPVAKGHNATLTATPDSNIENLSYGLGWERSTDGGKTWDIYNDESVQSISVPTDDERIGNQFRVILTAKDDKGEERTAISDPVTIEDANDPETPCLSSVQVVQISPIAGDMARFIALFEEVQGDPLALSNPHYEWQQSEDDGETWTKCLFDTGTSTLRIPTTEIDEDAPKSDSTAKLILIRVVVTNVSSHDPLISPPVPFTVRVGGGKSDDDNKSQAIEEGLNKSTPTSNTNTNNNSNPDPDPDTEPIQDLDENPVSSQEPEQVQPQTEQEPEQKPEQKKTERKVTEIPEPEINEAVSKQAKQQKTPKKADSSNPGAKWTEISARPSSEELQNALANNPFAPFAVPLGLGITVAGGLEKLLAFRRQL